MKQATELEPCPFCGGGARRFTVGTNAWFGTGCDGDQSCPAHLRALTHKTQAEADAAWNRRTPPAAAELLRLHAENETLRKTNAAARGTDAQIIKERELCAYAFAGAIADGLSGGAGPDTQNAEWLRPAFEAGQEIAQLRAEIATLRKREEKLCKRCTPVCQGGV